MAQSGATIKAKIERKIFSKPPASDITIEEVTKGDGDYGGFGGTTKTYGAATATVGVPYGFISASTSFMKMGFNSEGTSMIAVPEATSIKAGDKVTITSEGLIGFVTEVKEYPYNNVNLARIVTIKEQL